MLFITDKNIKDFMTFYRDQFPEASVLPKMHFLEQHVVGWMKRWRVGFGLMGEQGAESIHAAFNALKPTYTNIPDEVEKVKCMLTEHHRQVCPILAQCQPKIKRRKKTDGDNE